MKILVIFKALLLSAVLTPSLSFSATPTDLGKCKFLITLYSGTSKGPTMQETICYKNRNEQQEALKAFEAQQRFLWSRTNGVNRWFIRRPIATEIPE